MTRYSVRNLLGLLPIALSCGCSEPVEGPPQTFAGTVKQELAAGRYTYFQLDVASDGDRWIVVADRSQRGAERMTVESCRPRRDFASRRLNRTFSLLYFCSPSKS